MNSIFRNILDWSEVWALLIPLALILSTRNKTPYLRPIRIYVYVALLLNIVTDVAWKFRDELNLQEGDFFWNNNWLYNIGSCVRLLLFAWFFIGLRQRFMHRVKALVPIAFIIFLLVNFIFFENFFPNTMYETFSSRLLATEAALLLFYCMQYFIFLVAEDKMGQPTRVQGFYVVLGLSIYTTVNFFIFLFWEHLAIEFRKFALGIWDVHNITFILFCILLGYQFARENRKPSIQ